MHLDISNDIHFDICLPLGIYSNEDSIDTWNSSGKDGIII